MSEQNADVEAFDRAVRWIAKNRSAEAARAFMRQQLSASLEDLRRELRALQDSCVKLEEINSAAADAVRAELKGLVP